ncbi:MAG: class III signal peptide-containing protein [Candidatus Micrarchaeota archaeon]
MENRSQGSLEYIMLLGGILLIVTLSIVIIRGGVLPQAQHTIDTNYHDYVTITNTSNCTLAGC